MCIRHLFMGLNRTEKTVTYSVDRDTLPCEIHEFREIDASLQDVFSRVKVYEKNGYTVTVDTLTMHYETKGQ